MGVKLTKGDITKTKGKFKPKALLTVIDELGELMSSDDFRAVSNIKQNMGSIGRLGRAAGCHMVLATQKASSGTVSSELMNNIHQRAVLGDFDGGVSSTLFEKDISHMCKPEIKGRGFMKSGSQMYEFQCYWTDPKTDFMFEDKMLIDQLKEYRENNPIEKEDKPEEESSTPTEQPPGEVDFEARRREMMKSRGFSGPTVAGEETRRRPPMSRDPFDGMSKPNNEGNNVAPTVAETKPPISTRDIASVANNATTGMNRSITEVTRTPSGMNQSSTEESRSNGDNIGNNEENKPENTAKRTINIVKEDANPLASRQRRAETIEKLNAVNIEEGVEYKS